MQFQLPEKILKEIITEADAQMSQVNACSK